jgi:uncharacterized sulfatase
MLYFLLLIQGMCLAADRPNMVFILGDDMNRDSWGAYGSVDCKTPNIDDLAREGLLFENVYCSTAMCAPFRQELYSGRSPWRTKTLSNHSISTAGTKSIAHYLKALGYRVALLGKNHVGPKKAYPFEYIQGGDKKKDQNPIFLSKARAFMDSCVKENTPFCLFVASSDSHAPFTTGDRSKYRASELTIPPYWVDTPTLREVLVSYYAEVSNFDDLVGDMRKELERRDLWKDTIFMVCSEQGSQLPFAKWTCYDQGLHSGLIMHWGGLANMGSSISEMISIADITPTLVAAAGGSLDEGDVDGKSFLRLVKGVEDGQDKEGGKNEVEAKGGLAEHHQYLYGAFTNCNIINNLNRVFPIRSIRSRDYTLIYNPNFRDITSNTTLSLALKYLRGGKSKKLDTASSWMALSNKNAKEQGLVHKLHHRPEYEFYHRSKDPYELHNEIDNPEYLPVIRQLKHDLFLKLKALGDADPVATEKSLIKKKSKNKSKKKSK